MKLALLSPLVKKLTCNILWFLLSLQNCYIRVRKVWKSCNKHAYYLALIIFLAALYFFILFLVPYQENLFFANQIYELIKEWIRVNTNWWFFLLVLKGEMDLYLETENKYVLAKVYLKSYAAMSQRIYWKPKIRLTKKILQYFWETHSQYLVNTILYPPI